MKKQVGWFLLIGGVCGGAWASEPGCYRTAEAAAAQAGVRGVDGFRLEGRQRDVFSGVVWATVKSCAHPERPGMLVMAAGEPGRAVPGARSVVTAPVMAAGTSVTLVETEEFARIEMQGVAQGSGVVGDRVKVRLLTLTADGRDRFVEGNVRGSNVVEVVAR